LEGAREQILPSFLAEFIKLKAHGIFILLLNTQTGEKCQKATPTP